MPLPDLVGPAAPVSTPPPPPPSESQSVPIDLPPTPPVPSAPARSLPQVNANFHVKYAPGDGPPGLFGSPAESSGPKTKEQYLDNLAARARPGAFKLLVRRLKPSSYDGYRLTLAPIEELDLLPHSALTSAIKELHGGGEYQVLVKNADGEVVESMFVNIDMVMDPPKVPVNAMKLATAGGGPFLLGPGQPGGGQGNIPGMQAAGSVQESPEMVELRRLRHEEQREMQSEQTHRARLRNLRAEREFQKASREEGEEDMQAITALREEMRAAQAAQAQQIQQMMSGLKDVVTALVSKPAEDRTLPVLVETMKESRESQARADERAREMASEQTKLMLGMLTAVMGRNNGGENMEIMKMAVHSVEKVAEQAKRPDHAEKLMTTMMEALFTNRIQGSGRELDMFMKGAEFMQSRAENEVPPESMVNPEDGFLPNLGRMILHGVSRLVSGGAGSVGNRLGALLTPQAAPQFALPAPVNEVPTFQPSGGEQQVPDFRPQPTQVQAPMPVQVQPAAPPPQPAPANITPLYTGVLVESSAAASSMTLPTVTDEELPGHVTEAVKIAISDLTVGRTDQDWADYAHGKWGHFLGALVRAGTPEARVQLIQAQCDPNVYQQFVQTISANPAGFQNFINSLHAMLNEYQQETRNAVA